MKVPWLLLMLLTATLAQAGASGEVALFSSATAGSPLPDGWKQRAVAKVPAARISLVEDAGTTVLQVSSEGSAGVATHAMNAELRPGLTLAWRWKIDRVIASADLERRSGDDFAARVYVFFDVPHDSLPWATRLKMRLARVLYGEELPTAGICYVWDNRHAVNTSRWSSYTDRIRIVVQESGAARVGHWVEARRNLEEDFRAAFGSDWSGPLPAVNGVALGSDSDQTGEAAVARFGDVRVVPR